jgi:SAM-dependent methyltransferase
MSEWRLFDPAAPPPWTTAGWYADRPRAWHAEQLGHRERLQATAVQIAQLCADTPLKTISDLGAGDGGLLQKLIPLQLAGVRAWGYDLQPSNIAGAAQRGVPVHRKDILDLDSIELGRLVALAEVLEHLVDPHGYLQRLAGRANADRAWVVVASSPMLETAERHYEHHLWAWDPDGYAAMFRGSGWDVTVHVPAVPGRPDVDAQLLVAVPS